ASGRWTPPRSYHGRVVEPTKRSNHSWGPIAADGWSSCRHCGLKEHTTEPGFRGDSRVALSVIIWAAPSGRVLRIRPIRDIYAPKAIQDLPTLEEAFPGVEIDRTPPCPKQPGNWE